MVEEDLEKIVEFYKSKGFNPEIKTSVGIHEKGLLIIAHPGCKLVDLYPFEKGRENSEDFKEIIRFFDNLGYNIVRPHC